MDVLLVDASIKTMEEEKYVARTFPYAAAHSQPPSHAAGH